MALSLPTGCDAWTTPAAKSGGTIGAQVDFVDPDATDEERRYLEAARPFVVALAANEPEAAYACLSRYATARMTLEQFAPVADEADGAGNEPSAIESVTAAQFARLFQKTVAVYGAPHAVDYLVVDSTDPLILAGEPGDDPQSQREASLAVGGVPDSLPKDIRRAALSGRISTSHAPRQLRQLAAQYDLTPEELAADEGLRPYFNLKLLVVEEDGQLKIGYFVFRPPSILQ